MQEGTLMFVMMALSLQLKYAHLPHLDACVTTIFTYCFFLQGGPPIRSAARPTVRTVVPLRTEMSRLEVSRKESIAAESSWADGLRTKLPRMETGRPEVSQVDTPKQDSPRRTEAPDVETSIVAPASVAKPKPVASAWEPPSSRCVLLLMFFWMFILRVPSLFLRW